MKIKIQNKVIVLLVLTFFISIGWIYSVGADYLHEQAELAFEAGDYVSAFAHYDALLNRYPKDKRVSEALVRSAHILARNTKRTAKFFSNGFSITILDNEIEMSKNMLSLEERYWLFYNNYCASPAAELAHNISTVVRELGLILENRSYQKAEEFYWEVVEAEEWPDLNARIEATKSLVNMYIKQKRFEEALDAIKYWDNHLDQLVPPLAEYLADVYFAMGDYETADVIYEQYNINTSEYRVKEKYERLQLFLASQHQLQTIEGQVLLADEPMQNVAILIGEIIREDQHTYSYLSGDGELLTMTDLQGRFSAVLLPGEYRIGIELTEEQIKQVDGMQLHISHGMLDLTHRQDAELIEFQFVQPIQLTNPVPGYLLDEEPVMIEWLPYPSAIEYQLEIRFETVTSGKSCIYYLLGNKQRETNYSLELLLNDVGVSDIDIYDTLKIIVHALDENGTRISSSDSLQLLSNTAKPGTIRINKNTNKPHIMLLDDFKPSSQCRDIRR